jgi:hypothetical protein
LPAPAASRLKSGSLPGAKRKKNESTTHISGATDSWLQRLLTWTPGQTDMIKTVALVLMVTDHTGLLLAGNNEVMRLLGRVVFRCSVWHGE